MPQTPGSCRDLTDHLELLKANGLLHVVDRPIDKDSELHPLVRWQYRGHIPEPERKAFLFTNVTDAKGRSYPGAAVAVGALAGNRAIYALGMGCPEEAIGDTWIRAMANPVAPRVVEKAPCQEVVLTGDDLKGEGRGLDALPIPVSTPGWDTAPYFTAALWVSRDPDSGIQNLGLYRGNLKAGDRVAVMMERSTLAGGGVHWEKYRKRGEPMPVAAVLGAPPLVAFTGPQKLPLDVDELTVAGALAGSPVEVVRCKTVDLLVPAHAQVIVEGTIDTARLEPEGPFGESHGYMALEEYNYSMTVTAITRRANYVISSIISQVTPCESSVIKKVAYEPLYLAHLRDTLNIKGVTRVSMHEPLTNLRRFLFVSVKAGTPRTEIWRALEGAASFTPAIGKFCIAIDEDIDPENADHVLWAMAYRCNPAQDTHVIPFRGPGHGPKLKGSDGDATMLVDATAKGTYPPVALPKREYMERARALWEELGLPRLTPESPWSGYSLGDWSEEWDACALRAAKGDWMANGRRSAANMSATASPQEPAVGIVFKE
ncbi:3-octaprenyl-4-hydroxybenzoate carboxy-lyase [Fundidesulfovibrio magnetotacticus]|uniref:3-octaprenyl-4-hydroxybenzoate carboxy-lyase n=1 Tax=Fundidesulfovibrio magnetotacticus TaxID=2730080 RepID=A0A6V8LVI3_9BACT|nr:UbiD family decarboxylase [Fundidesulfovibrio magnetotacticus]GFK94601.1 3-octaprenyl-4-hydroxybenzoate carboxy-lyase [Fundidesulfovibrio magnetotacticus]